MLALAYNVPLNYMVGLPWVAVVSALVGALFATLYYLSRVKRKTMLAMLIFCIAGDLMFIAVFFLNSGINGPTDIFFILTMVMMVAIVPVSQYWVWVITNVIIVSGLHYLQYSFPELVPNAYHEEVNRYVDITSAYFTVVAVALFSFYLIRRNYESERKSAEQKTAMMRLLNEEKNKLFSIISHDLRAPLSNIQNYLELLTVVDISEDERFKINSDLLQSTRSTLDLLNNVLSWSKSQMQGLSFKLSPYNVYQLLSSPMLLFIRIAESKNIRLEISIDPKLEVVANGDMLQLVIRNLINNAIKFTAPGGRIIFSAQRHDDLCHFMVKDSGTGKPVKLSTDIFYLNSDSTAGTSNEKGVGLGLVLCKEFTEAQNGRIWFESDSVSGSSFFVQLPLVSEEEVVRMETLFTQ
ncbi:sensor histidine kinase [Mucilaginibacter galii]|uniref:sensor histidine kinase n=1 Tax=Mucilaginibacter galii TaxID=2005073 RepID=UPI00166889BF|nr:HAMP domain-containing sensor histidine kinase [Mucilaginibacter galii]